MMATVAVVESDSLLHTRITTLPRDSENLIYFGYRCWGSFGFPTPKKVNLSMMGLRRLVVFCGEENRCLGYMEDPLSGWHVHAR